MTREKAVEERASARKLERASVRKMERASQAKLERASSAKLERPSTAKLERASKRDVSAQAPSEPPPAPAKRKLWSRRGELFRSFVDALRDILRAERRPDPE